VRHRFVGASALRVSEMGLGTWQHVNSANQATADLLVRTALDQGITLFDTADSYQGAQTALAHALRGVRRDEFVLSSKVYFATNIGSGLAAQHIRASVEASLTELGTDHLDLLIAHRFDHRVPLEETLSAFGGLITAGKIRYYGVSEWTGEQIERACELAAQLSIPPPTANQPQYSILWRSPEASVTAVCQRAGMGLLAYFPLAQGVLTGKYRPHIAPPPGTRAATQLGQATMAGMLQDEVLQRVELFATVAKRRGLTPAQLALAWVLDRPAVSSVLVGASRPDQLIDNAGASGVELDAKTRELIDKVFAGCIYRGPDHHGDG
jgi:aryl-alcohol dehydrogenase-like predicted oxidoreductase